MAKIKAKQDTTAYEVITQEDPKTGDLLIPIPPELLERLGWGQDTEVEFGVDKTGRIVIKRVN